MRPRVRHTCVPSRQRRHAVLSWARLYASFVPNLGHSICRPSVNPGGDRRFGRTPGKFPVLHRLGSLALETVHPRCRARSASRWREFRNHGDTLAAHWAALDSHFQCHGRMVNRCRLVPIPCSACGEPRPTRKTKFLRDFAREALIERAGTAMAKAGEVEALLGKAAKWPANSGSAAVACTVR